MQDDTREVPYPFRHSSRRLNAFCSYFARKGIRRLTTNVGVNIILFIHSDSTITSTPHSVRLNRAEETGTHISYACRYLCRRRELLRYQLTTTARLRRFTTNVGVYMASCVPVLSTVSSNSRCERLSLVAEPDHSMAHASPYTCQYFRGVESFSA